MTTHAERYPDLTGGEFNLLTALRRVDDDRNGARRYLCRCACGQELEVRGANLTSGAQVSCGCWRAEVQRARAVRRHAGPRGDGGRLLDKRCRLRWRGARRGAP